MDKLKERDKIAQIVSTHFGFDVGCAILAALENLPYSVLSDGEVEAKYGTTVVNILADLVVE